VNAAHVRHVDDGELIRLLDGECSAEERARIESHLATCAECAQRREGLDGLAHAVSTALVRGDEPVRSLRVPGRRWRPPAIRAAAVLLLVSVGVAAASVPPVRAWLSARWADLRGIVAPRATPGPESRGATTVRFVPTAGAFTIELVARQDTGVLTIDVSADTLASATVTPSLRGEDLIVLPGGLRIVNRPSDRASYEVRLPRGVTEVRIQVADAPERRVRRPVGGAAPWTIHLNEQEL
jgi:anti-sigma factor RsiW